MNNNTSESFEKVSQSDFFHIRDILKSRLPNSANVYNASLLLESFPDEMGCYIHGEIGPNAIILITYEREDYGTVHCTSLPENFNLTKELKQAFSKFTNWSSSLLYALTDRRITKTISEIATQIHGKMFNNYPNYILHMDIEEAENLQIEVPQGTTLVKNKDLPLSIFLPFLEKYWFGYNPASAIYFSKMVQKNIAVGLIGSDGSLACAAVVDAHGVIGALNTAPQHKRKGYGAVVMKTLLKEMANKGFVPLSSSIMENEDSLRFHEKIGMRKLMAVDMLWRLEGAYHQKESEK